MYDTKFICTYNTPEVFIESDNISQEEKEFVRDVIYRQELLNIFVIDSYNETEIDAAILELYEKVEHCLVLEECMLKLAGNFMTNNKKIGFMMLYSYDYMHLTHTCVSDFLENSKIDETNIAKLKAAIF